MFNAHRFRARRLAQHYPITLFYRKNLSDNFCWNSTSSVTKFHKKKVMNCSNSFHTCFNFSSLFTRSIYASNNNNEKNIFFSRLMVLLNGHKPQKLSRLNCIKETCGIIAVGKSIISVHIQNGIPSAAPTKSRAFRLCSNVLTPQVQMEETQLMQSNFLKQRKAQ